MVRQSSLALVDSHLDGWMCWPIHQTANAGHLKETTENQYLCRQKRSLKKFQDVTRIVSNSHSAHLPWTEHSGQLMLCSTYWDSTSTLTWSHDHRDNQQEWVRTNFPPDPSRRELCSCPRSFGASDSKMFSVPARKSDNFQCFLTPPKGGHRQNPFATETCCCKCDTLTGDNKHANESSCSR